MSTKIKIGSLVLQLSDDMRTCAVSAGWNFASVAHLTADQLDALATQVSALAGIMRGRAALRAEYCFDTSKKAPSPKARPGSYSVRGSRTLSLDEEAPTQVKKFSTP